MASLFGRLDAVAQRTHEAVFGEEFLHKPKKPAADLNAASIDDTSRPQAVYQLIYRDIDASAQIPDAADPRADRRPGVSGNKHYIEVDPRTSACRPAVRDIFVRQETGKVWRVTAVDPDEMGRLICSVGVV